MLSDETRRNSSQGLFVLSLAAARLLRWKVCIGLAPSPLKIADMPHDAVVHRIPDRLPKASRPRVLFLHERRNPPSPFLGQAFFDLGNQGAGDAAPSKAGVDDQAVDIAAPAVERA